MHMRKHQRRFMHREENYLAKSQAQLESLKQLGTMTFYVVMILSSVGFWYYHRRLKVLRGVKNERNIGHTYTLLETSEADNVETRADEYGRVYDANGAEVDTPSAEYDGTSVSKIEFELNREMRSKFKYLN